jgi:hypothetical protein
VAAVLADGKLCWFVQHGAGCEALDLAAPLPARWLHDTFTLLRCHLPVRLDVFGVRVHILSALSRLCATAVLLSLVTAFFTCNVSVLSFMQLSGCAMSSLSS